MPLFYFQESALAKFMSSSSIILHLHPALDHAFEVLRDESKTEGLDYSGVERDGIIRGGAGKILGGGVFTS